MCLLCFLCLFVGWLIHTRVLLRRETCDHQGVEYDTHVPPKACPSEETAPRYRASTRARKTHRLQPAILTTSSSMCCQPDCPTVPSALDHRALPGNSGREKFQCLRK